MSNILVKGTRDAYATRRTRGFQTDCDYDGLAMQIACVGDGVADVDPNAQADALVGERFGIMFQHLLLDPHSATDRALHAVEHDQQAVASSLHDTPPERIEGRPHKTLAQVADAAGHPRIVGGDQDCIADDVGMQHGDKTPLAVTGGSSHHGHGCQPPARSGAPYPPEAVSVARVSAPRIVGRALIISRRGCSVLRPRTMAAVVHPAQGFDVVRSAVTTLRKPSKGCRAMIRVIRLGPVLSVAVVWLLSGCTPPNAPSLAAAPADYTKCPFSPYAHNTDPEDSYVNIREDSNDVMEVLLPKQSDNTFRPVGCQNP